MDLFDLKKGTIVYVRMTNPETEKNEIREARFSDLQMVSDGAWNKIVEIAGLPRQSVKDGMEFYPTVEDAINETNRIGLPTPQKVINRIKSVEKVDVSTKEITVYRWNGVEAVPYHIQHYSFDILNDKLIFRLDTECYLTKEECINANSITIHRFSDYNLVDTTPKKKKYNVRIFLHTFVDFYDVEAENEKEASELADSMEYDMGQILDNMTPSDEDIIESSTGH